MTRLPVDSWDVRPRLDLPPYSLNTVCPVTGEVSGLEDHHIFRRSFTAIGQDNRDLFWVEYTTTKYVPLSFQNDVPQPGETFVVKNRVALSPEAHLRITTNRARLEYRGTDLWYIEDGEEKLLDLNLHLMAKGETVSKKRRSKQASTPEERKARVNFTIRTPQGEEMVLPELVDAAREILAPEFGWNADVPSYFVVSAALVKVIQG